ncbi:hypothetical protein OM945_13685, partial [Levilactobacillus namurensis]|nr:hypothetical protein [Levilactobacillus namurensis]
CSADDEAPAMHEGATGCGRGWAMRGLGVGGLSNDKPIAFIACWGRALRFIDGPGTDFLVTQSEVNIIAAV